MRTRDESVPAVQAAQAQAVALNASAAGSEHLLLGLLSARGALTDRILADHPELTAESVRRAVVEAADDAPHLLRLGVDLDAVRRAEEALAAGPQATLPSRLTAEFLRANEDSALKYRELIRDGRLPRRARVDATALCWLAVLEPSSRAHRLLDALGVDPDRLRAAVLEALAEPAPAPPWPASARRTVLDRLYDRFAERAYVAN